MHTRKKKMCVCVCVPQEYVHVFQHNLAAVTEELCLFQSVFEGKEREEMKRAEERLKLDNAVEGKKLQK